MARVGGANNLREEAFYERKYRSVLNDMGGFCKKMDHRVEAGWPDNVAPPNIWFECKKIVWKSDRPINFWRHFKDRQIICMRELATRGADVYCVVFWDLGEVYGLRVQTIHFLSGRRHERWTRDLVVPFSDPIDEIEQHVRTCWSVERVGGTPSIRPSAEAKTQLDHATIAAWRGAT